MDQTSQAQKPRGDWDTIREAFLSRVPIPSLTELSAEYGRHLSTISRMANEENWADMRAKRAEQRLREAGASELILKAIQGEGALVQECRITAQKAVRCADQIVEQLEAESENKTSTRASTLNNVCFALANLAKFIEAVGLVGMPRDLRNSKRNSDGNDAGQTWEKGMLQQINVTVQNLQSQAKPEPKPIEELGE